MPKSAKATKSQIAQANKSLHMYTVQGAVFTSEVYQHKNWIFKATMPCGSHKAVVIGPRGAVIDHWFA